MVCLGVLFASVQSSTSEFDKEVVLLRGSCHRKNQRSCGPGN